MTKDNVSRETFPLTASSESDLVAAGGVVTMTASTSVDIERRLITGEIVDYGVKGHTSMGPTIFLGGSLKLPSVLSRVKLIIEHVKNNAAVGYLQSIDIQSKLATFKVPPGAEGDEALEKAANGLRDGLSVGVEVTAHSFDSQGNLVVKSARLYEVSLCTIPAYENSRVLEVIATHETEEIKMNPEQLAAALAAGTIQQTAHDEQLAAWNAAHPVEVAASSNPVAPVAPVAPILVQAQAAPIVPPGAAASSSGPASFDVRAASTFVADYLRAGNPAGGLTAALADITVDSDLGESLRPKWIDEVWTADKSERPLIDIATSGGDIDGLSVAGWKHVGEPEVVEYDGLKTDIHSNEWSTIGVTADAQPFAGGWDIERRFIDLGSPQFINNAFKRAVKSYKRNTENYVRTKLLAAATTLPGGTTLPSLTAVLTQLGVSAVAIGSEISFVQMGATAWAEFVAMDEADVPWWLKNQGEINLGTTGGTAGNIKFSVGSGLAARAVLSGDGQAYTWYEKEPPIQVQAENIPKGGVDIGVFGYGALIVNDARALFKTAIAAPAA
jgi:HK97 family phage prohead protease